MVRQFVRLARSRPIADTPTRKPNDIQSSRRGRVLVVRGDGGLDENRCGLGVLADVYVLFVCNALIAYVPFRQERTFAKIGPTTELRD